MAGRLAFGECSWFVEWAHLSARRRSKTRGEAPGQRHTTAGSLALCSFHHSLYDRHVLDIEPLTPSGADGRLAFVKGPHREEE